LEISGDADELIFHSYTPISDRKFRRN